MAILSAMRTEVKARGYNDVTDARVDAWLNEGYYRVCDWMPWPFLETTISGASPLTITDLGEVLAVTNTESDFPLDYVDRRIVLAVDDDMNQLGVPQLWWLEDNTVYVWPGSSTDTVTVRYVKTPVLLTAADTPIIPTRWHYLLVEWAVYKAKLDNDTDDSAQVARATWNQDMDLMVQAHMDRNLAGGTSMIVADHKDF